MNLDANSFLASMLVSSVGFVLFMYGKKMQRVPHMATGLILLVYPYFVSSVFLMLAIGALLCLLLWVAVKQGM